MGQYIKPIPLPDGIPVSCVLHDVALVSIFNDTKINPPFTPGCPSRSFPGTLRTKTFTRLTFAGQGRLNHVS